MTGDRALEKAKQWARRLVGLHTLAASNANRKEQVEGHQTDGDDPDYQLPVERMQQYGFRSRAGAGARIVTVAPEGGVSQRIAIASEVPGTGPDQEEWEVETYCKHGQRLIYDKDGHATLQVADGKKVTVTANGATIEIGIDGIVKVDSPAGKDVIVNGGTLCVARATDPVDATASFASWVAAVQAALVVIQGTGIAITLPAAPTSLGLIRTSAGAARFKG